MCKGCKAECPSNVDVAKHKAEFLQIYYQDRPRPLGHRLVAGVHRMNRLGAPLAPLLNLLQSRRSFRWLLEKVAGIDRRRSLPPLHRRHFRRWFARHTPEAPTSGTPGTRGRVLLLADCFTTYNEPDIGRAAVRVLERAGYTVELADLVCCGRPMISKGFLHQTRDSDSGTGRRSGPAAGRRHAVARSGTELSPDPGRRMDRTAAGNADANHRRRRPSRRQLAGAAGPERAL